MNTIVSIIRYFLLLLLSGLIATIFQPQLTSFYKYLFPNEIGGGFDISFIGVVALFYSFEFLATLLITVLGDKHRYWTAGIVIVLLGTLEFLTDQFSFGTPVIILFSGLILGLLIRFAAAQTLGKVSAFEPLKKYF